MNRLEFLYRMESEFEHAITHHDFSLKCIPRSDSRQHILSQKIVIKPETNLSEITDSFGNKVIYGQIKEPHHNFLAEIRGVAEIQDNPDQDFSQRAHPMYSYPSPLTIPGKHILAFYQQIQPVKVMSDYEKTRHFMKCLFEIFTYEPGSTTISTTAEAAMLHRKGVCQDYAHILLSLCRLGGIAARYVVGIMLGEGYSHAWVEIFSGGLWYGFDPTNNLEVDENYIKISHGRDFSDCIVNRGVFRGGGGQSMTVKVQVKNNDNLEDNYD